VHRPHQSYARTDLYLASRQGDVITEAEFQSLVDGP
jgi:hypothetical protein